MSAEDPSLESGCEKQTKPDGLCGPIIAIPAKWMEAKTRTRNRISWSNVGSWNLPSREGGREGRKAREQPLSCQRPKASCGEPEIPKGILASQMSLSDQRTKMG